MELKRYDTTTLLGVYRDLDVPGNYWRSIGFNRTMTFDTQYVEFEKLSNTRKLAPLVVPTAQGRPIYSEASKLTRVKPAYVKPKDAVEPASVMPRTVGALLNDGNNGSPSARWNQAVAARLQEHRYAIERRWEWMAARAIIDGKVTLVDKDYPETIVDFERDPAHTVVLTGTAVWDGVDSNILGDIENWRALIRNAKFSGPATRLTVGTEVWEVMRKDPDLLKLLDTQIRGTKGAFVSGLREGDSIEYVGQLSDTLQVYVYNEYYDDENGAAIPFMSSKDIVLTGNNIQGVQCFGAILDAKAGLRALPVFPKMWDQEDPSATFVMTQSAPLMVPVNPNNTLKATVLA